MKFKYNYLNNRLWKIDPNNPEYLYEILGQFQANFDGNGFFLEAERNWITFTIYEKKIKVFAKFLQNGEAIYYRKEFTVAPLNQMPLTVPNYAREIKFEFTEKDQVIRNEKGWWVKK